MPKFVIDEDMPRSTGTILKEHGYDVKDRIIRGWGLKSGMKSELFKTI
jgi:hypothetical protein